MVKRTLVRAIAVIVLLASGYAVVSSAGPLTSSPSAVRQAHKR